MKNKFHTIQPWLGQILHTIKREIKTEHLAKSPVFYRTHFGHRPQGRLTFEEIAAVYERQLLQGDEELAQWVINRWVFTHGEIYQHFADRLSQINPDFNEIQELSEEQSEQVLSGAAQEFGALPIYLFAILNGVVFPESVFQRLRAVAEQEETTQKEEQRIVETGKQLEQTIASHQREVSRLKEKYEEKIAGIMRKYTTDVEALKKQIRALQKRLS